MRGVQLIVGIFGYLWMLQINASIWRNFLLNKVNLMGEHLSFILIYIVSILLHLQEFLRRQPGNVSFAGGENSPQIFHCGDSKHTSS